MLEGLLPAEVAAVEAFDDAVPCRLFPEEEAVVAGSVDKRRREFTTARWCARQALARLGRLAVPILPGKRGAPGWPAGVVGSITHCAGYRAAAVADARDVRTVGLDAEPNGPLPDGVLEAVSSAGERQWVARLLADEPAVRWDRLLFSAKESVYKAWFPLTQRWLDFEEAELVVDPAAGTFRAELLVPGPTLPDGSVVRGFDGRWLVRRDLVVTAIVVLVAQAADSASGAGHTPAAGNNGW